MGPKTLDHLISAWRDENLARDADLNSSRSRAGQLLAITGVLGVLATLGAAPLPENWASALVIVALVLFLFFYCGTVWLTYHAIKVIEWQVPFANPPVPGTQELQEARRQFAKDLLRAANANKLRLSVPTGYLKDAFRFFAVTSITMAFIVVFRVFATSLPMTTPAKPGSPGHVASTATSAPHSLHPSASPTSTPRATVGPMITPPAQAREGSLREQASSGAPG